MKRITLYIALDVHNDSITIATRTLRLLATTRISVIRDISGQPSPEFPLFRTITF